ncbi:protease modulator HflC [bacterium]|nr:protease modulator HflC [candidate division CSSED10-310 bacterium]
MTRLMQIGVISALVLIIVLLMFGPFYVVEEGQQALVLRFGAIVSVQRDAGLHFKFPLVDQVKYYSKRILSWDGEAKRLPTKESQFIFFDSTARWRIVDPQKFYESVSTVEAANSRLDDVIDSEVKKTVALFPLIEVVRNSNVINEIERTDTMLISTNQGEESLGTYEEVIFPGVSMGRRHLSRMIKDNVDQIVPKYGIEVIDVIIRQIKYSDELTASVYQRMIKERNQVAQKFRSDGEGQKAEWFGKTERELLRIRSEAYERAETIKGEADAAAAAIYADAYNQDAEFYAFWKAMESYKLVMPALSTTISTDLDFFEYLHSPLGASSAE